ncbi:MAG TPA: CoA transferase [Acidimicrobiales bacterium]|nr:CoA transferase [Acidimicrobiales bacterium]
MRQLLDGLVVVEVSEEPAGQFCGKAFADLGAEVVKVEPAQGDRLRQREGMFLHLNTNKHSVVADDIAPWLRRAHVVIESLGWGDLASRGVDVDVLRMELPSLVVATISGFGADGPYAGYKWTDLTGQAAAWSTLPQGYSEEEAPVKLPGITALSITGQTAALGALAACLRAGASGAGARVDCAMYEAMGSVPSRATRFLGWQYNRRQPTVVVSTGSSATLLPNGVFPCRDGYVSLQVTPQQLAAMLDVLDDDALRAAFADPDAYLRPETKDAIDAALYPWLLSHTRAELTAVAQAAGWPFTGLNTPAEVLEAGHLHQRGYWAHWPHPVHGTVLLPGPPYRHSEGGWRVRRGAPALGAPDAPRVPAAPARVRWSGPADPSAPPLTGIRVLDLTTVWSGPYGTQLLADLGAEVIRVENPSVFPPSTKGYEPRPNQKMVFGGLLAGYGPAAPGRPDRPYNRHAMNNSVSRNKRSCTLDPRRPEAKELLLRLVECSDVFIENLKVSALHRMGIQEGELRDRNPRLIVVRAPPAGLTGEWSAFKGLGAQFDALSGLSWLVGHHDRELVDAPLAVYMDSATGPAAAFAVAAALLYRESTGRGQLVELAQLENVTGHLGDVLVDQQLGVPAERLGNRDRECAPQGVYRCRGDFRWLAVSVTSDAEWAALAPIVGGDARMGAAERRARHDELDALVSAWAAGQDAVEAFHALQQAGVPASPVLVDDLLEADPHVATRGWLRPLASTDVGTFPHVGHAFSGVPQRWDRGSPALGEDNRYVYQGILGLDDAAYAHLVGEAIAVSDYLDRELKPV